MGKEPWARTTLDCWEDLNQSGAVTFTVELSGGTVVRRHMEQLKHNVVTETQLTQSESDDTQVSTSADISIPDCVSEDPVTSPELRQSTRVRRPPSRFSPDNY